MPNMKKISLTVMILGFIVAYPLWSQATIDSSPADNITKLIENEDEDEDDTSSVGERIPLVFIHGIHGNKPPDSDVDDIDHPYRGYWLNFLNYFYSPSNGLSDKYKVYRFHYVSDRYPVWEIARALRNDMEDKLSLTDKTLVIVAHSMGGLVARSYMNEHSHNMGAYSGKRGGVRVWDTYSKLDDVIYWGMLSKCWTCVLDPDDPNRSDRRWDN